MGTIFSSNKKSRITEQENTIRVLILAFFNELFCVILYDILYKLIKEIVSKRNVEL